VDSPSRNWAGGIPPSLLPSSFFLLFIKAAVPIIVSDKGLILKYNSEGNSTEQKWKSKMGEIDPIYLELAARIQCEDSKYVPQILAKLASLEQARILRELPASSPAEIADNLKLDREAVDKHLRELYEKGLVFPTAKEGLRFTYSITELKDSTASNPKFDKALGSEFFALWDAWFDSGEPLRLLEKLPPQPGRTEPAMRVIAKWKSIKDTPGILPCDDIRELLRAHRDTLTVNNCSCRRISRSRAPGSLPDELCFVIDKTARYCVDRGTGRRITLKEAMDILERAEEYPLVHITYNTKPMLRLIGNCGNYCIIFRWSPPKTIRNCAPSRFRPVVAANRCLGCKKCVAACLFDAARMKYYPEFGEERAYIDADRCMGCGNCVIQCPIGARTMKLVRLPEFIPDEYVR